MNARIFLFLMLASTSLSFAQQRKTVETTKRSIRMDVPLTSSIRKALKDGTRDFSGKPGPNYWQLQTDYTIQASLDPHTQTITGTEKIDVYNNSKEELTRIVLRL